ncbi:mycothiol transferase [Knoellia aerolata]|uniref:mycothiol transferase n=1 Tax=Knoellia aerolata TaxID=442954 RepID=UPI00055BDE52|nr:DUF664 domain-containing protein [Knoellia aerolata]
MSEQPTAGFPEPPAVGDEVVTLLGSLERQRATFTWKCADLTAEQLRLRLPSSELSLARLLKHLAWMEDLNFTRDLAHEEVPAPWADVDAETRSEWAFESADRDSADTLYALWGSAAERSRRAVLAALGPDGLGATYRDGNGNEATLRRLLVDMIEEYGRHTGHADLLREAIDGRVGEDPPGRPVAFTVG